MRHLMKLSLPALAASLLLAACGSSSNSTTSSSTAATGAPAANTSAAQSSTSGVVVHTISNPSYGTILINSQGMTLYRLSGEHSGKFICSTSACVAIWHPLIATSGTPTGVSGLGTVKRPDGTAQVAYNGEPLYTFAQDHQAGETNGQGIKDVGTWAVVSTGAATTGSGGESGSGGGSSEPSEPSSSGGGKSYGY